MLPVSQWRGGALGKEALGQKDNAVILCEAKTLHIAKQHLKRLTKDNTKVIGRHLMKVCVILILTILIIINSSLGYDELPHYHL